MWKKVVMVVFFIMLFTSPSIAGEAVERDYGKQPWVVNLEDLTVKNEHFRVAKWTGRNLQMTVMSLKAGEEIGLEKHDKGDQFIRVEQGIARVVMGRSKNKMTFDKKVSDGWAIFIPRGFWHNVVNEGDGPLKVYVIYAPPEHPTGTLHKAFKESQAAHGH
ncbi:MAG: cupin domain-containing protein [Candidatus Hadarchaeum sp.]